MIEKIQNKDIDTANEMRSIFMASYAVEAKLLNATNFPPLNRPLTNYIECPNDFFGYKIDHELGGIIEVNHKSPYTHIQSLVVHPKFFRQGLATKLMATVLNSFDDKPYMVETGVDNGPAIALYKKLHFKEVKQWDTDYGIRKVRFVRSL